MFIDECELEIEDAEEDEDGEIYESNTNTPVMRATDSDDGAVGVRGSLSNDELHEMHADLDDGAADSDSSRVRSPTGSDNGIATTSSYSLVQSDEVAAATVFNTLNGGSDVSSIPPTAVADSMKSAVAESDTVQNKLAHTSCAIEEVDAEL